MKSFTPLFVVHLQFEFTLRLKPQQGDRGNGQRDAKYSQTRQVFSVNQDRQNDSDDKMHTGYGSDDGQWSNRQCF